MDISRRVTAIVVHYSTPELTAECVAHIRAQAVTGLDIVVVENASDAAQAERLRQLLPAERVVETRRSLGFAHGLNAGMQAVRSSNPDFYWVVTPDVAANPGCLEAMLAAMARDPRLGICGPVIDAAGEWITGCRLIEPLGFLVRIECVEEEAGLSALPAVVKTDFVEGGSMLIRAETARQIGPFRLEFFLYYEECEYCLRARDLGWSLAVIPAARVRTRARKPDRNARSYYLIRNSIVLARLRRRHASAAVVRGLVETGIRSLRQPAFFTSGLKAVRDGLSLGLSATRGELHRPASTAGSSAST